MTLADGFVPPRSDHLRVLPSPPSPEPVLRYRIRQTEDASEIELQGILAEEEWTDRLLDFMDEHFLRADERVISLDLEGVCYVDLEGVATLIRMATVARDRGKRLYIHGARGPVRETLQRTGVLDILTDRDEGLRAAQG